jgi:CDP-glucose 4,6-dehydratase
MEGLGVMLFADIYRGRRVLITGHTGFKGSWLALWLKELGADVSGIALDPDTQANHWHLLKLDAADHRQDIRDASKVQALVEAARPEVVFHLAAQPLVRRSYREPIENWSTNVMGTAHVLEACRQAGSVKAIVAVTTDKVYANQEWPWGYRENDRLGGHDPYSASKAACEILIESYQKAFFNHDKELLLASARGGNVIGGGDWSEDRLIPDLVRAVSQHQPLLIRSPQATRPWQHVLECLAGYLLLGQKLLEARREYAGAWNFGPGPEDNRTVAEVLTLLRVHWPELVWEQTRDSQPHEATLLYLDHAKARTILGWQPVWNIEQALQATADWYRRFHEKGAVDSRDQLAKYIDAARSVRASWVQT